MIILMLMAGSNEAFQQQGFAYAKPLVEIDGKPIAEHAMDSLKDIEAKFVFVIRKEDDMRFHLADMLSLLNPGSSVVKTENPTAGAACTALLAIEHFVPDEELVIANGDQVFTADVGRVIDEFRSRDLDAGTIVFDSVHPRWSFVRLGADDLVIEAAEKRPLSRLATAGLYYFKKASDFVEAAQLMMIKGAAVNGAYYVCPVFNELILKSRRIGVARIDREQYISLATPQAVDEYEQFLAARRRMSAV